MLFSSLEFLFLFFPLTVGAYFLCPLKLRNAFLLIVSLAFYGFGEPIYLFLMLLTVTADYIFGILIERSQKRKKGWLVTGIVFNLSLLFFFKYYGLLSDLLSLKSLDIKLPIGISFYTFQAMSYIIDVYRMQVRAQKNYVAFGTYVSLFPQLIAGPIVRYSDVNEALSNRKHTVARVTEGLVTFSAGLAKKAILANTAGELSEGLLSANSSPAALWLGLIMFAFQIYYDFSGYSDMAVGLGRIFGFDFPMNFNYPYISRSITEFWRRWHITLSSWFREYLYIPLGGNRRGRLRTYLNLFVVWSLTGLWHGASWNFLFWGIYFFVILAIEKTFLLKVLDRIPKVFGHLYAHFFILLGWLIFYSEGGASQISMYLSALFGFSGESFFTPSFWYLLLRNLPFVLILCVGATPLPKRMAERLTASTPRLFLNLRNILCLCAIILSTAYIISAEYNPFLYFRF